MANDQMVRIAVAFASQTDSAPNTSLCAASMEVLDVDGTGISLMSGQHTGTVGAANEMSSKLEDLQFTLGEGPGREALATALPVLAPDLRQFNPRWPAFSSGALDGRD